MKNKTIFIFSFFLLFLIFISGTALGSNVITVEITDTIDQATVEIIKESQQRAELEDSQAIILLLKTPGGGLTQTFEIADIINESKIPFIGYVYPSGSAAWSAGTFILMSTHIAAMGDNTIIGSCQPVEVGPTGTRLINDSKTINALTKWIETRAEMYDRNKTTAKEFITKNLNLNESEALRKDVIEYRSSSIERLLVDINGTVVKTSKGDVVLDTIAARQIKHTPSIGVLFMKFFSNPVLVSLLFMLGVFALIFGISSPGIGAEVFGIIAILISLIGSGFSISILSIIFIVIGIILLVVEIYVIPGFGAAGIGGIISLLIGSIFLIPSYPNKEWLITMDWIQDAIIVVIAVVVLVAIFFVYLLYKILEIRKKKKATNVYIGGKATAIDKITPGKPGYVRYKGEYWKATSDDTIEQDSKVIIVGRDESILKVKAKKE